MRSKSCNPSDRTVLLSIAILLGYVALVATAAFVATALQPGGPF
jgi:hypothetical protein